MQRIAYLCGSNSWGGLEMNQWRNAMWMRGRGHEVVVLGLDDSPMQRHCRQDGLHFLSIREHRKYYDFSAGKALAKLLDEHQVKHLIIRDVRDMSVAVIAKRKSTGDVQLHYFMEMQLGVRKTNLLHTLRFRQLDTWSCPLVWLTEQVKTMTRMPHDRICHIPSGLELSAFQNGPSKADARKLLDLPASEILVGLAGRFDPQKGQLLLLEAMKNLPHLHFGVVLLGEPTHGEGEHYYTTMLATIAANDLSDRVHVRPFRKDISTFYHAIDAFVMASKAETFGMVTIESMACGTPVIGSNAGGTTELLHNGEIGYLFEPLSADDLAAKIADFLDNPHRFSPTQLQVAVAPFDHNHVCDLVEERLGFTA